MKNRWLGNDEGEILTEGIWGEVSRTGAVLDPIYLYQFVQNETTTLERGETTTSLFDPLEHGSTIMSGTLTGEIYERRPGSRRVLIYRFSDLLDGRLEFSNMGRHSPAYIIRGEINNNAEISIEWYNPPGFHDMIVSYEYAMDPDNARPYGLSRPVMPQPVLPVRRKRKLKNFNWMKEGF